MSYPSSRQDSSASVSCFSSNFASHPAAANSKAEQSNAKHLSLFIDLTRDFPDIASHLLKMVSHSVVEGDAVPGRDIA
jgi:hypothetical protein